MARPGGSGPLRRVLRPKAPNFTKIQHSHERHEGGAHVPGQQRCRAVEIRRRGIGIEPVGQAPGRCSNPHSAPSACQNHGPSSGSPTSIWTRGTRGSSTLLERPKSVLPRHECSVSTFSTLSDVSALPVHRAFAASRFREAATGYGQPALCRRSDNGRSSWSRYRHSECAGPSRHSAGRAG